MVALPPPLLILGVAMVVSLAEHGQGASSSTSRGRSGGHNYLCTLPCTDKKVNVFQWNVKDKALATGGEYTGCVDRDTELAWYNVTPSVGACRGAGRLSAQRWSWRQSNSSSGRIVSDSSNFGLAPCHDITTATNISSAASCMSPPQAWLQPIDAGETNATAWQQIPQGGAAGKGILLKNVANGQCLAACPGRQYPPVPPAPQMATCAKDSPSEESAWCDASASFEDRAAALVANLTLVEKAVLWTVTGMATPIARINLKGYTWDHTCKRARPNIHLRAQMFVRTKLPSLHTHTYIHTLWNHPLIFPSLLFISSFHPLFIF